MTGQQSLTYDAFVARATADRAAGMPGLERYALARARVVLDRLDGGIAEILAAKARLGADEAFGAADRWLDARATC